MFWSGKIIFTRGGGILNLWRYEATKQLLFETGTNLKYHYLENVNISYLDPVPNQKPQTHQN